MILNVKEARKGFLEVENGPWERGCQISIKSSACNTPEVKIQCKIARNGNKKLAKKKCLYLEILHARIIHDGTINKKLSFAEIYLVQFSVNCNMPFFDVS